MSHLIDLVWEYLCPYSQSQLIACFTLQTLPLKPPSSLLYLQLDIISTLPYIPSLRGLSASVAAGNLAAVLEPNSVSLRVITISILESGVSEIPILPSLEELTILSVNDCLAEIDAWELSQVVRAVADWDAVKTIRLEGVRFNGRVMELVDAVAMLPEVWFVWLPIGEELSSLEWARYRIHKMSMFHGFMVTCDCLIAFTGNPIEPMRDSFKLCYEGAKEANRLMRCEVNLDENEAIWTDLSGDDQEYVQRHLYPRVMVWLNSEGVHAETKEQRVSDASTTESL